MLRQGTHALQCNRPRSTAGARVKGRVRAGGGKGKGERSDEGARAQGNSEDASSVFGCLKLIPVCAQVPSHLIDLVLKVLAPVREVA